MAYRTYDAWARYGPLLPNQYIRTPWWTFRRLADGLIHSSGREA